MWFESMNSLKSSVTQKGCSQTKQVQTQRFNHKWIIQKILYENWTASSLHISIKHFMCTLLGEMVLVRNVGHSCRANTENDLAKQVNSETVKT